MLRVVFMGTPDFSVPALAAIRDAGHEVVAVYTQPPRPAGRRGLSETLSPVHHFAADHQIEVRTPLNLKSPEDQQAFADLAPDVAVVIAYGLLLPQAVLDVPRHGCVNVHASKLPRWRGAAPIQRAIMAGDTETAVMVMRMEAGLDTGPVGLAETVAIGPDQTAGQLHDVLSECGARLIVEALAKIDAGTLNYVPQPTDGVTYAKKIEKGEARINFDATAHDVHNQIRGLSPFPGAWFEAPDGARVKVLESRIVEASQVVEIGVATIETADQLAAPHPVPGTVLDDDLTVRCREGAVRFEVLQKAGKKPMARADFLRGNKIASGTVL